MAPCPHTNVSIDRTMCSCGLRHVYCVTCETKVDDDVCPWIPDQMTFRSYLRHLWGGGGALD
jgi:hypothetical protein